MTIGCLTRAPDLPYPRSTVAHPEWRRPEAGLLARSIPLSDRSSVTLPARSFDAVLKAARNGLVFTAFEVVRGASPFDLSTIPHPTRPVDRSDAGELHQVDQPGFDDLSVAVVRRDGTEVVNIFPRLSAVDAIITAHFVAQFEDWGAHDPMATPNRTCLS
jgi:hypothetical protein